MRHTGSPINRAIRFIQASQSNDDGLQLSQIIEDDPSLEAAIRLASSPGRQRFELHCRVLARQDSEEIAVQMEFTKPVIETYCDLFFDVRSHLEATDFIVHQVAGMPVEGPPSVPTLILTSAYFNGPRVMEACLNYLDHLGETHDLATEEGRRREAIELSFQAQIIENSPDMNASLSKHASLIFTDHPTTAPHQSASGMISENISQMLTELDWNQERPPQAENLIQERYVESYSPCMAYSG